MILQKYIAQNSNISRRKAADLILAGRVFINDKKAEVGMLYQEGAVVKIDNTIITKKENKKVYIKLNKPSGYVCTNRKFKDEKNVFDLISGFNPDELIITGRLDKDSRGLVILTNDGDYVYKNTHPSFNVPKTYIVKIANDENLNLSFSKIKTAFLNGIDIKEGDGIAKAKEIKEIAENTYEVILIQGKKRQIRRMFNELGFKVIDLIRTKIGDVELGLLKESKWEYF